VYFGIVDMSIVSDNCFKTRALIDYCIASRQVFPADPLFLFRFVISSLLPLICFVIVYLPWLIMRMYCKYLSSFFGYMLFV